MATDTFQIFPHLASVPAALCGDPRWWLLCSSNSILDVTILPGAVLLPGTFWEKRHTCPPLWPPRWGTKGTDSDYNRKHISQHGWVHMHNKCNNIFTKQYLLLLLAMDSTFYFIHFISFNAGFNPIHQFYDPRIGLNSQFGKHCPHSGFLWSTSPGAWFIGWIVGSIPKIRKQFHTCLFFFFCSQNGQLSE